MEQNIEEIYKWIDGYTISRQKRNISRDFSDAGSYHFTSIQIRFEFRP